MDFTFSPHALDRMWQNGLGPEDIDAVLSDPRWMPPTTRGTRYDGILGDGRLAVVVDEERTVPHIVTVFWVGGRRTE